MTGLQIEKSRAIEQHRHNVEIETIEKDKLSEAHRANVAQEYTNAARLQIAWYDSKTNRDNVWFNHQDRLAQIQQRAEEARQNIQYKYSELMQNAIDRMEDRRLRQWEIVHNYENNRDRNLIESGKSMSNSIWSGMRAGMAVGATTGSFFGPVGSAVGAAGGAAVGGITGYIATDNTNNIGGHYYGKEFKSSQTIGGGGRSW